MKRIIVIAALTVAMIGAAYSMDIWDSVSGADSEQAVLMTVSDTAKSSVKGTLNTEITADTADSGDTAKTEDSAYDPETCIKVHGFVGSRAMVRLYSTTEISKPRYYDLYTIEKRDGKWVKKAYIRTIELPPANKIRNGKYKYYSDVMQIEWLSKGYVYQLIPQKKKGNNHSSVPFWRKDLT